MEFEDSLTNEINELLSEIETKRREELEPSEIKKTSVHCYPKGNA